nr:hypothetical protein JVH1_6857 [Rhodococcus sp. JVH1]
MPNGDDRGPLREGEGEGGTVGVVERVFRPCRWVSTGFVALRGVRLGYRHDRGRLTQPASGGVEAPARRSAVCGMRSGWRRSASTAATAIPSNPIGLGQC